MVGVRCFAAAVLGLAFLGIGVLVVTQGPGPSYRWSGEAAISAGVACLAVMVVGLRDRPRRRTVELPKID
ncbi:hypothetical protein [Amycolatopsis sp. 195334CR]|uniref:hypothetical protein n=1 Tax=Amycolatopsis sp. 195334CR TaxID=2814588 RepID=UPI001A8E4DC8|nr:hypothetical protein [Amycolatopsis sp. 195334CR]MBN6034626.1 hypothetical protein [Amycolatopsis sp. 195334CR]